MWWVFFAFKVFRIITSNFADVDPGLLASLHDTPWTMIKLAHTARKQGLTEVCLNSLSKLYSVATMDVQVCLVCFAFVLSCVLCGCFVPVCVLFVAFHRKSMPVSVGSYLCCASAYASPLLLCVYASVLDERAKRWLFFFEVG